jgi:hypothetical protein
MGDPFKAWGRCGMPCGLRDSILWPTKAGHPLTRGKERVNHRCLLKEHHSGACQFIGNCERG